MKKYRAYVVGAVAGILVYLVVSDWLYVHAALAAHTNYINAIIAHLNGGAVS